MKGVYIDQVFMILCFHGEDNDKRNSHFIRLCHGPGIYVKIAFSLIHSFNSHNNPMT